MDSRSDIQVLKVKLIYRKIKSYYNRRPYQGSGSVNLVSSFLINQRTYTFDPESLNRTIVKRLKEIGFFRMYPGKHNKRRELIKVCDADSLRFYTYPLFKPGRDKPILKAKKNGSVTIFFEGNFLAAKIIAPGFAEFNHSRGCTRFKLVLGHWILDEEVEDLPF